MSKNFLSSIKSTKCRFTIIAHSSKNDFEKTKVCINGLIENISNESEIMIINFSKTPELVSEFESDKNIVKDNVKKNLKYMGSDSKLLLALDLFSSKIDTKNKELKNFVVFITNGEISDDPFEKIRDMMGKGVSFSTIGIGKFNLDRLEKSFVGQIITLYEKYDDISNHIEKVSPSNTDLPITYSLYPKNNQTQKSHEDLILNMKISPKDNTQKIDEGAIEISILENTYYYGYREINNEKICSESGYNVTLILRVKPNCEILDLPEIIDFKIRVHREVYSLFFSLDTAWFAGDLETPFKINIFVDGFIGNGKSSFLNILFNLFTSKKIIDQVFYTSKNNQGHTTNGIQYKSITRLLQLKSYSNEFLPIYKDIINKIKITLVDKPGMFISSNCIDYQMATKGCYIHNPEQIDAGGPVLENECHSLIFIVSMRCIGKKSEYDFIQSRINDFLKTKIQPILVITFSDMFSEEEQKKLNEDIYKLSVEKENIFFLVPYINNEAKRDPSKDLIGWKIMKRAVEISRQTMIQKMESMSDEEISKLLSNNLNINSNSPQGFNINPLKQHSDDSVCSPSSAPDIASLNTPEKQKNLIIISVSDDSKTLKFKIQSDTIVKEIYSAVSKMFSINSKFNLEDSDGCILFGDGPINEYLSEKECKLYIKF